MVKLIYAAITSLDGYITDENGSIEWTTPDEEVIACVNDLERPIGTHLYGRRMYEAMAVWEDPRFVVDQPLVLGDFAAIWQAADKNSVLREATGGLQRQDADRAGLPANAVGRMFYPDQCIGRNRGWGCIFQRADPLR